MEPKRYRTKAETVNYFRMLADAFETSAVRAEGEEERLIDLGKSEAYELAAFEVERNTREGW